MLGAGDRCPGGLRRRERAVLILNGAQVEALVDLDALIDALASALADLSSGRASAPDRVAALVPE
jgi:alanine dehydrogenase